MADEATQEVEETSTVEETTADSQSGEQTTDTQSQETGDQTSSNTENASSSDNEQSKSQDSKSDSKPLSRRSMVYRIRQLAKENAVLKKQSGQSGQTDEQNEWEQPAQDENPNIADLVAKEVERLINPVINESSKAADDGEINELFSGERAGERTKYEGAIREMWKLPQYKDVAASELYKIASFDDAVSTAVAKGIEDYKKAEKEAKESSASGTSNSNRTGKGGKSITDLSDEEFAARNERIKAGLPV